MAEEVAAGIESGVDDRTESMTDYCDKPEERTQNPRAKNLVRRIAKGNDNAYRLMWTVWCFTHLYDDLVDKDKPVTNAEAAENLAKFIHELSNNPFYQQHKASLSLALVNACDRWIVGDRMQASEDHVVRQMGRVVRCGDIDFFAGVAFAVGGWEHLRAVSEEIRKYDE